MALSDYKITDNDISAKGVVSAPDKLTGTAQQNKAVFDRLIREVVKGCLNDVIDALNSEDGATEVGFTNITGLTAANVQSAVSALKIIVDSKASQAYTEAELALKSDKSATNKHFKDVSLNESTGVFTFTKEDGTTKTIDTLLEKIAINFEYDAANQRIVLTLKDGTKQYIPLSDFITENEFIDTATIDFSVASHVVSASIKNGSITDAMLSSGLVAELEEYVTSASTSATNAAISEQNALTYKNQAQTAKTIAESARDTAVTSADSATNDAATAVAAKDNAVSAKNTAVSAKETAVSAKDEAIRASGDAVSAKNTAVSSKDIAANKSLISEGYAVGQQNGTDVGPESEYYHNNAKYFSEELSTVVVYDETEPTDSIPINADCLEGHGASFFAKAAEFLTHVLDAAIHVTQLDKDEWNGKYKKPNGGIPKLDLANDVQASLAKADSAIQEHNIIYTEVEYDG